MSQLVSSGGCAGWRKGCVDVAIHWAAGGCVVWQGLCGCSAVHWAGEGRGGVMYLRAREVFSISAGGGLGSITILYFILRACEPIPALNCFLLRVAQARAC